MKKTNPSYFFAVLVGLFAMFIGLLFFSEALNGAFVGIIMGIIIFLGFIILAIKLSNGTFEKRMETKTTCSGCGKEIESNTEFCPHCGVSQNEVIICSYCSHENKVSNVNCDKCNALLK